jgi:hypothetical protein
VLAELLAALDAVLGVATVRERDARQTHRLQRRRDRQGPKAAQTVAKPLCARRLRRRRVGRIQQIEHLIKYDFERRQLNRALRQQRGRKRRALCGEGREQRLANAEK